MQFSAQEPRLFGLFIVASDGSDLTYYNMVTGEMIASFMKRFVEFKVNNVFKATLSVKTVTE